MEGDGAGPRSAELHLPDGGGEEADRGGLHGSHDAQVRDGKGCNHPSAVPALRRAPRPVQAPGREDDPVDRPRAVLVGGAGRAVLRLVDEGGDRPEAELLALPARRNREAAHREMHGLNSF
ncbi:MAG: hypothetical protein AAB467_01900 [Patescibacteria group bacterium]